MPGGSADPFVALLEWLVGDAHGGDGSIEELAKRCGVRVRTLRDWAAGSYPTERNSRQVQRLHVWAVGAVRGYPPPDGSGPSLVQLSGPERLFSAAPDRTAAGAGPAADMAVQSPTPDVTDPPLQPRPAGRRRPSNGYFVTGLAAVVAAALVGLGVHTHWWRSSAPAPGASSAGAATRTAVPAGPTVVEYSDNQRGTEVYASPTGESVGSLAPGRIPFRTLVRVRCQVPDGTGAPSVHALYLIASGRWRGLYGVADTFTNGDRLGASGGREVDPRVPDCP